jgi:hypothetical protein
MRGRTHCRSHSDPELGPRGGGAPQGNLNALYAGCEKSLAALTRAENSSKNKFREIKYRNSRHEG